MNEAETCRTLVRPKLEAAGWLANGERHYEEQIAITAGRVGRAGRRQAATAEEEGARLPALVHPRQPARGGRSQIEESAGGGRMQQDKEYARILRLNFAYATNGTDVVEYDAFTQAETTLNAFPPAVELWQRQQAGLARTSAVPNALLVPDYLDEKKRPRYYQRIAIE